jgi:hypothetical protein
MYNTNMGTKLQLGSDGDNPTFTDIPRLRNVPGLALEAQKIEVTHNQSKSREYIPDCLPDPGDYSFDMETDRSDAVHQTLFTMRGTTAVRPFRLIYPDGLAWQFSASVMSITRADYDAQSPDVIIDTVALSINGDIEDISDNLLS